MEYSIKIEGKLLKSLLTKFPSRMKNVVKNSLGKTAEKVRNRAKQNAPVLTGNLRRSIHDEVKKDVAIVGTNVQYAKVREYNTRSKPKGYMRPALEETQKEVPKIFAKEIKKALRP